MKIASQIQETKFIEIFYYKMFFYFFFNIKFANFFKLTVFQLLK